jgi:hypothetical protein
LYFDIHNDVAKRRETINTTIQQHKKKDVCASQKQLFCWGGRPDFGTNNLIGQLHKRSVKKQAFY